MKIVQIAILIIVSTIMLRQYYNVGNIERIERIDRKIDQILIKMQSP